jgi:hypothetical protein
VDRYVVPETVKLEGGDGDREIERERGRRERTTASQIAVLYLVSVLYLVVFILHWFLKGRKLNEQ